MSDDDEECPYAFPCSDDEVHAMRWLINTLTMICEHKRPNADKAATALKVVERLGNHRRKLHERVHELEDVMHVAGLHEMDPSEIERFTSGELN
jgi:hypothetical protein